MEQVVNGLIGKTFNDVSAKMVLDDAKEGAVDGVLSTDYMYGLIIGMEPKKAKDMFKIDWSSGC